MKNPIYILRSIYHAIQRLTPAEIQFTNALSDELTDADLARLMDEWENDPPEIKYPNPTNYIERWVNSGQIGEPEDWMSDTEWDIYAVRGGPECKHYNLLDHSTYTDHCPDCNQKLLQESEAMK